MFNIRISLIISGFVFVLSFLIGLMSRSSFPVLLLRPVFFGILFFALTTLITLLINRFLPELLEDPAAKTPELIIPGSRIDIKEDAAAAMSAISSAIPPAAAGNLYARPDDSDENLGNISEAGNVSSDPGQSAEPFSGFSGLKDMAGLSAGMPAGPAGMDQTGKNEYNGLGNIPAPDSGGGFDVLPDLESLAGAFMPSAGNKEEEIQDYPGIDAPKRPVSGNKPQKMDADFHPKELAAGIRTILKKEEG